MKRIRTGILYVCLALFFCACGTAGEDLTLPDESQEEMSQNEDLLKDQNDSAADLSAELQAQQTAEPEAETTPEPTDEPQTEDQEEVEPAPILTEEYELIYEGVDLWENGGPSFFKYGDDHADLYMRWLRDHTGEYVELSLWNGQNELWHTENINEYSGVTGVVSPMYYNNTDRYFSLDQRLCYYVVEIDGTVYLMRYSVETVSNAVTMSYTVFGTSYIPVAPQGGYEEPFDFGSITVYLASDGVVDPSVSFPVDEMTAFADTVRDYMEKGQLAASTLQGVYEFGVSADRDNPVSPYLYDIFPWIPELIAAHSVDTEGIHSPKQMLAALQKILPADTSVAMPDVEPDGKYFVTGDYYSEDNESHLTIRMRENGVYGGTILIQNLIYENFAGYFKDGKLKVVLISDVDSSWPFDMEISFQNGKATATITALYEEPFYINVGDTFILDRNVKPYELRFLKNAEDRTR